MSSKYQKEVEQLMSRISEVRDYGSFCRTVGDFDVAMARRVQNNRPLYQYKYAQNVEDIRRVLRVEREGEGVLEVPRSKDMTDAFLRSTLGHEEQLLASYN